MPKGIAELNQNLDDYRDLIVAYQGALATAETQKAQLVQDVAAANQATADAVAAMNLKQAEKDAIQALLDAQTQAVADAVDKSDAIENDARAGLPGVPPIETPTDPGTPVVDPDPTTPTDPVVTGILAPSYASRADFDAAVAAFTGSEQVTVDGTEVYAATDATMAPAVYFSHSATGAVDTTGPTD